MNWTHLSFGKHKDKSLPHVLLIDPDWFYWAIATDVFPMGSSLAHEASILKYKSTNIALPEIDGEPQHVEHYIDHRTKKYSHFALVAQAHPLHMGSSQVVRHDRLDMTVPRSFARYDKLGYRNFLRSFRTYFILGRNISKQRSDDFFSDDDNFEGLGKPDA